MFAMTFKCFPGVLQVFQMYVASVLAIFGRMLQVFHLGVPKVDMMLHMLQWIHLSQPPAAAAG
jgi:hypothetical protein